MYKSRSRFRKYFIVDFYYAVLRKDIQRSTFITDIVFKAIAIITISISRFVKNSNNVAASALTFYSVLAFIPVAALVIAIARGFGVAKFLENELRSQSIANQDVIDFIVSFATRALENTSGGLVTGLGIVILLWAVIKVLGSAEHAFNRIWGVTKGRSLVKKFTDYLSLMFIAPILLILVSSINVFLSSNLQAIAMEDGILSYAGTLISSLMNIVPYLLVWILFIFLYMFIPATPVKFKYAFWSGILAGTVYQIVQWFYIRFQIGVSSYNAVYGSLAALPLLLVWLQLSWSVVLWGGELCYISRNRHFMYRNALYKENKWIDNIEIAIRILRYITTEYMNNNGGPTLGMISQELRINTSKLRVVLELLTKKNILAEVSQDDDVSFYPAIDLHRLSLSDIIIRFSNIEEYKNEEWQRRFITSIEREFSGDKFA